MPTLYERAPPHARPPRRQRRHPPARHRLPRRGVAAVGAPVVAADGARPRVGAADLLTLPPAPRPPPAAPSSSGSGAELVRRIEAVGAADEEAEAAAAAALARTDGGSPTAAALAAWGALRQLMRSVEPYCHPSNVGGYSAAIGWLIQALAIVLAGAAPPRGRRQLERGGGAAATRRRRRLRPADAAHGARALRQERLCSRGWRSGRQVPRCARRRRLRARARARVGRRAEVLAVADRHPSRRRRRSYALSHLAAALDALPRRRRAGAPMRSAGVGGRRARKTATLEPVGPRRRPVDDRSRGSDRRDGRRLTTCRSSRREWRGGRTTRRDAERLRGARARRSSSRSIGVGSRCPRRTAPSARAEGHEPSWRAWRSTFARSCSAAISPPLGVEAAERGRSRRLLLRRWWTADVDALLQRLRARPPPLRSSPGCSTLRSRSARSDDDGSASARSSPPPPSLSPNVLARAVPVCARARREGRRRREMAHSGVRDLRSAGRMRPRSSRLGRGGAAPHRAAT